MSERNPKAEGMAWFNPHLTVKNVKGAIEFYEKAFGFKTRMTIPDKAGNVMHAELAYHDMVMMLGPECDEQNVKAPESLNGSPVALYIYVDKIEEFVANAEKAGAKITDPLTDQFWGDRTCAMRCPEGHKWTFAQNVADFDPSNMPT